jgi:hypothetical protein
MLMQELVCLVVILRLIVEDSLILTLNSTLTQSLEEVVYLAHLYNNLQELCLATCPVEVFLEITQHLDPFLAVQPPYSLHKILLRLILRKMMIMIQETMKMWAKAVTVLLVTYHQVTHLEIRVRILLARHLTRVLIPKFLIDMLTSSLSKLQRVTRKHLEMDNFQLSMQRSMIRKFIF